MGKFFSWLGNLIKSAIEGIINFFWEILKGIGQFFLDCWNYLWDWISWSFFCALDFLMSSFVALLDLLAENFSVDFDYSGLYTILESASAFNVILPLDTILLCGGIFFAWLLGWVVYKFVKSWLPWVSGT